MEALYAEAAYCTRGEERARALLESVRLMTGEDETNRWTLLAASLAPRAIFELETRAVEVDGRIVAGDVSGNAPGRPPYTCQPLATLEALDTHFALLNSTDRKEGQMRQAILDGDAVMVDLLILAGASPSGYIIWASADGFLPVVERLLQDVRVDPSVRHNYPITAASSNGHLPVVERLLQDERVDPSDTNNFAIRQAFELGHLPVVKRLIQDERVRSTLSAELLTTYSQLTS